MCIIILFICNNIIMTGYLILLILVLIILYYDKIIKNACILNTIIIITKIIKYIHDILIILNKISKLPFKIMNKMNDIYINLKQHIYYYKDHIITILIIIIAYLFN
jgi:hypothetical protein